MSLSKESALHEMHLTTLASQATYHEHQFALETLLEHVQPAYLNRVDALLQVDKLSALLRAREAELESVAEEKRDQDERLKKVEMELVESRRRLEGERKANEDARAKQSSAKEKELSKAIEMLHKEKATLQSTIQSLEDEVKGLTASRDELQQQFETDLANEKHVTSEQEKMGKYWQNLHDEVVSENTQLKDTLDNLRKEIDGEKQTRRRVEKELMSKDEDLRNAQNAPSEEIEGLKEETEKLQKALEEARSALKTLTRENKQLAKENEKSKAELKESQESLELADRQSANQSGETSRLKEQIELERQKYDELFKSIQREREQMRMAEDVAKTPKAAPTKKAGGRGNAKVTEPGEKSLFSTTPFLNKTVMMDEDEESEENDEERLLGITRKKAVQRSAQIGDDEEVAQPPKKRGRPPTKKKAGAAATAGGTTKATTSGRGKKRGSPVPPDDDEGNDDIMTAIQAGSKKKKKEETGGLSTNGLGGFPLFPPPTTKPTEHKKVKLLSQNRSILEDDDDDDDGNGNGNGIGVGGGLLGILGGGGKRAIKRTGRGRGTAAGNNNSIWGDLSSISPRKRSR